MIILSTELKYYLTLELYKKFRLALTPFMIKDPHTKEGQRAYDVHSIYYDSTSLINYYQKVDGEDEREKFRIRFYEYTQNKEDDIALFLELKQKRGAIIKKLRYKTNLQSLDLNNIEIEEAEAEKLPILQNYHLNKLMPVAKISYKREALVCAFGSDLRITFDSEITGAYSPNFHTRVAQNEKMLLNPLLVILEIKTADALPTWLTRLIKRFDIELTSYSKYAKAIENCSIIERSKGN